VTRDGERRRPRCRGCGWTFYDNPVPAVVGVLIVRGRILLARRARPPHAGTWDLPGGFLEAGETPQAGLARELYEELHVRLGTARLVAMVTDRYGPRGFPVLSILYAVTVRAGTVRPADDVSEARWFPLRAVPYRMIAFVGLRRALRRYLRRSAPPPRRPATGSSRRPRAGSS
jgi:ADP-ribose pyrophosphatase YjhB (NUDIX family)